MKHPRHIKGSSKELLASPLSYEGYDRNGQLTLSRRCALAFQSKTKMSTEMGPQHRKSEEKRQEKINKTGRKKPNLKYTPLGRRNAEAKAMGKSGRRLGGKVLQRGGKGKKQFQIFSLPGCRNFYVFLITGQSFCYLLFYFYCCCVIVRTREKKNSGDWRKTTMK